MSLRIIIILCIGLLSCILPELVMAKDVIPALRQSESRASEIFMVLGPISLIVSAVAFQFSKQLGFSMLLGSLIGITVYASRHSLMNLFVSTFS